MDYGIYINNYSGNNVNVAVLDCGVREEVVECKKHYKVSNDVVKEYDGLTHELDFHGTYCAQEIIKKAPKACIYDFNVSDEDNIINEKRIINALEFIINQNIDIVSISMKLLFFSEELNKIITKMHEEGIFVLASSDTNVSYPADLKYVLAIQSKFGDEKIIHINNKTICIEHGEYLYSIGDKTVELEPSSSLACAYYAGILALVIEGNMLLGFNAICDKLGFFNFEKEKHEENLFDVYDNTVIIDTSHSPQWYISNYRFFDDKIIGFYDFKNYCFVSRKNEVVDLCTIENIIEINYEHIVKKPMADQNRFQNIPYRLLGDFVYHEKKIKMSQYIIPDVDFIKYINKPIIYIAGFACGIQKFEILLELYKQFEAEGVHCSAMTSNAIGSIMGMNTFEYPKEVSYPQIVYQINETLDYISQKDEANMILVDIPGGITNLNWHNTFNFGMLFKAFVIAADPDFVIIMLNEGIDWNNLKKEIDQIKLNNIPNIIFCVSEYQFDLATAESEAGIQVIKSSKLRNEEFYEMAKRELIDYKVFRYCELKNGMMLKYILSLYS